MTPNKRELLDQRASLWNEAETLLLAGIETTEQRSAYNAKLAELDGIDAQLGDFNALEKRTLNRLEDPNIGMSKKELKSYSIVRAMRAASEVKNDSRAWEKIAPFEFEASQAAAKRMGKQPQGFYVPSDVIGEKRDLNVTTDTAGGFTVATDLLAASFIDVLRNKLVTKQAGARVLAGLVGNISIPKKTAASTAYWVAENVAPTEGAQTFGQVAMSPNTVGAFTDISRRLLMQSSLDVEALVRDDLAAILALEIDRVGLHGSGQSSEPTGVAATGSIGASAVGGTNGAAPTYDHLLLMERDVAVSNAELGALAYITNPKVRYVYKKTFTNATYGEIPVFQNGRMNDYPAFISNQVSHALSKGSASGTLSAIFYGNWSDLIIGMWGALDLLVDPYTGSTAGTVRVVALEDVDIAVRNAVSFSYMKDAVA